MKLGRYEVVRELGKGAMGIVYLAKDPLIGRLVALKTIRPAAHADDDETKEFQQRFLREAQAAGILNHPAIVTVHDIGQDDTSGVMFIAMEYVEGNNLKEVLQQGRPLSFEQIGDIIAQVAEALDFAHAKGIVHRDVKPANVILLEGGRAKITDFGIAKIASGGANLTTTGQFLGTPNYMAPEQIKGAPVDGRTDIFSLGICLYECLTRRKPFGGDSLTSISYKIVHEPFPPLHEINPMIPEGFEDVVARCLAKDPTKRYQRAKDLATALRQAARGERPVHVEPMLAEETVVTRSGHDRTPTVEMPFPEAMDATPEPSRTRPAMPHEAELPRAQSAPPGTTAPTVVAPAAPAAAAAARAPKGRVGQQLRNTLTNVRAYPIWKRRIHPAIFAAILVLLAGGLLAAVLSIQKQKPAERKVDVAAEKRREQERILRQQANQLLLARRYDEAYLKLQELAKLAPNSPAVTVMLQNVNALRQQQEISKQNLLLANQKLADGMAAFNEKRYEDAIPLLSESFSLNPNNPEAGNYLKLAQEEKIKADQLKQKERDQRRVAQTTPKLPVRPLPTATAVTDTTRTISNAPAQFSLAFTPTAADGQIIVAVGATTIFRENLWEERRRGLIRRKHPRPINVSKEITPAHADVKIWVNIPSLQVNEYRQLTHNFQPGSSNRLQVAFDPKSKTFSYVFH